MITPYSNATKEQVVSAANSYERRAVEAERQLVKCKQRCNAMRRVLRAIDEYWTDAATAGGKASLSPSALLLENDIVIAVEVAEALRDY